MSTRTRACIGFSAIAFIVLSLIAGSAKDDTPSSWPVAYLHAVVLLLIGGAIAGALFGILWWIDQGDT